MWAKMNGIVCNQFQLLCDCVAWVGSKKKNDESFCLMLATKSLVDVKNLFASIGNRNTLPCDAMLEVARCMVR